MTLAEGDRKVFWFSCAPWVPTGYGTQTGLFGPRVAELGYDVAFGAFYGLMGCTRTWQSRGRTFLVYPGSPHDGHANDVFGAHSKHWFEGTEGIVISLTDPWVMWSEVAGRLPLAAWTPVDHEPLMKVTTEWFKSTGAIPIAMSRFGERTMVEAGLDPLYVPHGFDGATFHPRERDEARSAIGMSDDAFVVGVVAANKGEPSRKGFAQMLAAYKVFSERHPGESELYLHTHVRAPDGENITAMCDILRIRPRIVHQYYYGLGIDPSSVSEVMSSFDVLINLAHGEGFGLPIIEAMACGVPAIVTDFSSMPEIVGDTGWRVGGQVEWTPFHSYQMCPSIEQAVQALEDAYAEPTADREARRVAVLEQVAPYEAAAVTSAHWEPSMREIEQRIDWSAKKRQVKAR